MSVATEKLTVLQDQVLDVVARLQEPVVNGVATLSTKVEGRLPEIKVPGLGDTVPTADQVLDASFGFGQKLLDNQKQFAEAVLKAAKPVRVKFVSDAKPAPKVTKVKAA